MPDIYYQHCFFSLCFAPPVAVFLHVLLTVLLLFALSVAVSLHVLLAVLLLSAPSVAVFPHMLLTVLLLSAPPVAVSLHVLLIVLLLSDLIFLIAVSSTHAIYCCPCSHSTLQALAAVSCMCCLQYYSVSRLINPTVL
jgi:hypothetical protein